MMKKTITITVEVGLVEAWSKEGKPFSLSGVCERAIREELEQIPSKTELLRRIERLQNELQKRNYT